MSQVAFQFAIFSRSGRKENHASFSRWHACIVANARKVAEYARALLHMVVYGSLCFLVFPLRSWVPQSYAAIKLRMDSASQARRRALATLGCNVRPSALKGGLTGQVTRWLPTMYEDAKRHFSPIVAATIVCSVVMAALVKPVVRHEKDISGVTGIFLCLAACQWGWTEYVKRSLIEQHTIAKKSWEKEKKELMRKQDKVRQVLIQAKNDWKDSDLNDSPPPFLPLPLNNTHKSSRVDTVKVLP